MKTSAVNTYSSKAIESLISRFEQQQLPKPEWTHEAHLVVAIWYNWHHSPEQANSLVSRLIPLHNESVGTPNTDHEGYHETITLFWMIVARKFMEDNKGKELTQTCNAFILSEKGKSSYPLEFYSREVLFSVKARLHWVEPDLASI